MHGVANHVCGRGRAADLAMYFPCLGADRRIALRHGEVLARMDEKAGIDGRAMVEGLKAGWVRAEVLFLCVPIFLSKVVIFKMLQVVPPDEYCVVLIKV